MPTAEPAALDTADAVLAALTTAEQFPPVVIVLSDPRASLYVRVLNADQLDEYAAAFKAAAADKKRETILAHALGDKNGNRLFTDPATAARLGKTLGRAAEKVMDKFLKLNGLADSGE